MARDERSLVEILDDHHAWVADNGAGTRANLVGLDLRDMDFRGSDLRNADMRGSNLSGADFAGADLRGANLS
ncbi:MAG: pentapeptide repeat-containing protein, partial [Rhodospirillales bacterium]|nr:pentapeptide repeat-containing protein [Rhodospirillales bacterium]